jgi:ketopantoate reductase
MREEDLGQALARLSDRMRERVVVVQNGFLEAVFGELGPVTRGLIWFTSKGDFFEVLAPSPFHGRHAAALAGALRAGGIAAEALDDSAAFRRAIVVKGIWNCIVGLPLAAHSVDLATYLRDHRAEAEALVAECARAASAEYRVEVSAIEAFRVLVETTRPLGWVRGGAKALPFRNGAIAQFGRRHGIPTPLTDRLLARSAS